MIVPMSRLPPTPEAPESADGTSGSGRNLSGLPRIGDTLADKYVIESMLGHGGMGVVFAARHVELGQRVAIKVLHDADEHAAERFLREARILAQLANDHIVRVLDFGRANQFPYL